MQNNNKPNGFRRFLRDNGYYLVIGACLLTIGVSGFYLVRSNSLSTETMSVPVRIESDSQDKTQKSGLSTEDLPTSGDSSVEEPVDTVDKSEDTVQEAVEIQPEESVVTARTVVMPVVGEVLTGYSAEALTYNNTMRDWRTHDGIDLAATAGMSVSAAEAGTVSAIYEDDYLGTTVEITHDSGYVTTYANLEKEPSVSVGQTVSAGDPIGIIGSSALLEVSDTAHLHFSVSKDGKSIDPNNYLPE